MRKSVKSRAEEQFAATQKKAKLAMAEKEKTQIERSERVANLRGLRLAKEAADLDAAEQAEAEKTAPKSKAKSKSKVKSQAKDLPQAHRQ